MGRNAYKEILKNPDNLVYITYERKVTDEYIVTYTDVIDVVAEQVYKEMTGGEIPNEKKNKSSKKFKQNPRFPKLWAKFKEDPVSICRAIIDEKLNEYQKGQTNSTNPDLVA